MLKPPLPLWNSPLGFSSQSESYATVHFQRLGIHKWLLGPRALNTLTASGFWQFCHEEVIPGTLGIVSILWDFLVLSIKTLKRFYPEHSHTDWRAVPAGPSLHCSALCPPHQSAATPLSGKITQDATHGLTVNNAGHEATPATSDVSLNFLKWPHTFCATAEDGLFWLFKHTLRENYQSEPQRNRSALPSPWL